jgi:hypothetical protein
MDFKSVLQSVIFLRKGNIDVNRVVSDTSSGLSHSSENIFGRCFSLMPLTSRGELLSFSGVKENKDPSHLLIRTFPSFRALVSNDEKFFRASIKV